MNDNDIEADDGELFPFGVLLWLALALAAFFAGCLL